MEQFVRLNNKGVSLVEVMVALLIALLVFFAMMQTALVGIDSNVRNLLRDEAVSVAQQQMDKARNVAYDALVSGTETVRRNIRNLKDPDNPSENIPFNTTTTVTELSNNKQINILVTWQWKGTNYSHSITTIRKTS